MDRIAHFVAAASQDRLAGRLLDAEAKLRQAQSLSPGDPQVCFYLATVLADQGRADEAIACYRLVLDREPRHAESHNNLGTLLMKRGDLTGAEFHFRQALESHPEHPLALANLGAALVDGGEYALALTYLESARRQLPGQPEVLSNVGFALARLGRPDEALEVLAQALALNPGSAAGHLNLATTLLMRGDYAAGFAEYEWRHQSAAARPFDPRWPLWDGESPGGSSIVLCAEQGLGDTLQFVRYARVLRSQWQRVIVECPTGLKRLLRLADGVDEVVSADDPPPQADCCASLLSLPLLLGTTPSTIPAGAPYLHAEPERVHEWRQRLAALSGIKVGIAWQGNPNYRGDCLRSIRLAEYAPLAQIPGVTLVNLQQGPGYDQLAPVKDVWPVVDFGNAVDAEVGAFVNTAALIANLDLVITSDTAVAHLAGAMGVRVWLLLSHVPDWRWCLDPSISPWYPTMRLFRQPNWGDWPRAIRSAAEALAQFAHAKGQAGPASRPDERAALPTGHGILARR